MSTVPTGMSKVIYYYIRNLRRERKKKEGGRQTDRQRQTDIQNRETDRHLTDRQADGTNDTVSDMHTYMRA